MLALLAAGLPAWAATAEPRVAEVRPLLPASPETAGQVADPRVSPDGGHLGFEVLGAAGDTLEVYVASLEWAGDRLSAGPPEPALPKPEADPFRLAGPGARPVSEHLSWGPPKRGKPRFAVAATRLAVSRGAANVNFDLFLTEPGRRRFLTDHPGNDAQPAFSPDGEFLAFTSGRSGQGDVYLYHFFAEADPYVPVSFEAAGSEIYPVWDPAGTRLAYTGHLGAEDHLYVVDQVRALAAEKDPERRKVAARRATRDLTPGWQDSCLAASFSPDGKWLAFYSREGKSGRADLYAVGVDGGSPRRLLQGGLPETRGGPRWASSGDGLFAVREEAERLNPLVWVPLEAGAPAVELATGTELNADPFPLVAGERVFLFFTAQGSAERAEKRWRQLYVAVLQPGQGAR